MSQYLGLSLIGRNKIVEVINSNDCNGTINLISIHNYQFYLNDIRNGNLDSMYQCNNELSEAAKKHFFELLQNEIFTIIFEFCQNITNGHKLNATIFIMIAIDILDKSRCITSTNIAVTFEELLMVEAIFKSNNLQNVTFVEYIEHSKNNNIFVPHIMNANVATSSSTGINFRQPIDMTLQNSAMFGVLYNENSVRPIVAMNFPPNEALMNAASITNNVIANDTRLRDTDTDKVDVTAINNKFESLFMYLYNVPDGPHNSLDKRMLAKQSTFELFDSSNLFKIMCYYLWARFAVRKLQVPNETVNILKEFINTYNAKFLLQKGVNHGWHIEVRMTRKYWKLIREVLNKYLSDCGNDDDDQSSDDKIICDLTTNDFHYTTVNRTWKQNCNTKTVHRQSSSSSTVSAGDDSDLEDGDGVS